MNPSATFQALLPPRLQPGPSRVLTDELGRLIDGGWAIPAIHQAVMAGMGPNSNAGAVIYRLRGLPDRPEQPTTTPVHLGHIPCTSHDDDCHICRCDPNRDPQHHRRSTNTRQGADDHRPNVITSQALLDTIQGILATDGPGPYTYTEPTRNGQTPGHLRCNCPNPTHTMALVATGHHIENVGGCPLHTAWAQTATPK